MRPSAPCRFVSQFHSDPSSLNQQKRSFREKKAEEPAAEEDEEEVVTLEELDLQSFAAVARNTSNASSVILYQIASCGFCSGNAHVFHTVKR